MLLLTQMQPTTVSSSPLRFRFNRRYTLNFLVSTASRILLVFNTSWIMVAVVSNAPQASHKTKTGNHSEKSKDVRMSNILAAKGVADAVRTSLGPRGMDKMVQLGNGEVLITNDGATILEKMKVEHPAAKMLVELSKSQDIVAGDGTTSVVVICGALLNACLGLLGMGIHPTIISESFAVALSESLKILESMAVPVKLSDRETLLRAASTSLNSKVVSQYASLLAPMAVDSVLKVAGENSVQISPASGDATIVAPTAGERTTDETGTSSGVDLKSIRVIKKLGGTIDDSMLIDGLLLNQSPEKSAGGPSKVNNAKVALIQFCLSPPKTDVENSVIVKDYAAMDRILREERQYLLGMCKKIKATGCNVLLIQKSILRDATTDLSLHFLSKLKIMVVTDIERNEVEFVSRSIGCVPIAEIDSFTAEKLAKVECVEEISLGSEKAVRLSGISSSASNQQKTVSLLVRGSNQLVLDEAERSLHDALCVIRSIVKKQFLIAGGGAPEIQIAVELANIAKTKTGMMAHCIKAYADALEVIPYTLAENAGLSPIHIVTELRRRHVEGEKNYGVNVRKSSVTNILDENVVMPLLVTYSALSLATECVRMILKIDDVVLTR